MLYWTMVKDTPRLNPGDFLSSDEWMDGQRYRHKGRQRQWWLGRLAAKRLLRSNASTLQIHPVTLADVVLRRTVDGWPQAASSSGQPLPVSVSITHTEDWACAAACSLQDGSVGIDMDQVQPRHPAFVEDYFTEQERRLLQSLPIACYPEAVTVLWCIKEAVLKALRTGLKVSPRRVEVCWLEDFFGKGWKSADGYLFTEKVSMVYWRRLQLGAKAYIVAAAVLNTRGDCDEHHTHDQGRYPGGYQQLSERSRDVLCDQRPGCACISPAR